MPARKKDKDKCAKCKAKIEVRTTGSELCESCRDKLILASSSMAIAVSRRLLKRASYTLAQIVKDGQGKEADEEDKEDAKWAKAELKVLPDRLEKLKRFEEKVRVREAIERKENMAARKKAEKKAETEKKTGRARKAAERAKSPEAKKRRSCGDGVVDFIVGHCTTIGKLQAATKKAVKLAYNKKKVDDKLKKIDNAVKRPNAGLTRMALGNMLRGSLKNALEGKKVKSEKAFFTAIS